MDIIENIQETLDYIRNLEKAYKEAEEENKELREVLQNVSRQLYDAKNRETVLTNAIKAVLNK